MIHVHRNECFRAIPQVYRDPSERVLITDFNQHGVEYRHEQIETLANVKAHKDGPSNYHDSSEFTFFTT
jgi:hypothetical protein